MSQKVTELCLTEYFSSMHFEMEVLILLCSNAEQSPALSFQSLEKDEKGSSGLSFRQEHVH